MAFLDFVKKYRKVYFSAFLDDKKDARDKDAFRVSGTQVYVGRQGSGKTISAVRHLIEIKNRYPKAIVVTNLQLNVPWDYTQFSSAGELMKLLTGVDNGKYGVVYLIDEIHTYFNSVESKGIPPYVFTEISQQRKQRKTIIGTSQLFMRIAKPFREQCDNMVSCNTWFGVFTRNRVYDGMTLEQDYDGSLIGDVKKRGFFWHSRELRQVFDTYQKVISAKTQMLQFDAVTKYDGKKRKRSF
jgi:hypothetical protein